MNIIITVLKDVQEFRCACSHIFENLKLMKQFRDSMDGVNLNDDNKILSSEHGLTIGQALLEFYILLLFHFPSCINILLVFSRSTSSQHDLTQKLEGSTYY